jgi:hypothetical protein
MSWRIKNGRAQYNYYPEWTRPGGTGDVRSYDSKRPQSRQSRPKNKAADKYPRTDPPRSE